jgi:NAD(P)-dependent dehydrogenase (short-subunit alcohol dehydrogenase family)
MQKLQDKVAVITGGSSGIGLATAKEFIAQGAKVVITGRTQATLDEAKREINSPHLLAVQSDTAHMNDLSALVQLVTDKFGRADTLFINAGIAALAPMEMISEEQFDQVMDINFKGAFFTLQKFLPLLTEGASVIFLSSINAYTGMPNTSVYAPSKAAMNSLMRTAAYELAPKSIRVNAVCPGLTDTPLFGKVGLNAEQIQGFTAAMQQRIPFKKFGQPADVAKLAAFLASDESAYITGSEYVIDGGLNLNPILV